MGITPDVILTTLGLMVVLGAAGTGIALLIQKLTGGPGEGFKGRQASQGHPATDIARIEARDRADARALYERVTRDKLEVIKTALAMGYSRQDLADLDTRLEELIGSDKLHKLIEADGGTAPSVADEILDADLVQQLETLHPRRGKEAE